MRSPPTALVLDADGELDIVCGMLTDLGVDFLYQRGSKPEPALPKPSRLLIAMAAQAIETGWHRGRSDGAVTWLACVRGRSKAQRRLLRQAGFDMLIPDNVHPAALLLLLRRACYEGENTQRVQRVAVGQSIQYGTRLRRHEGLLLDLSPRGCRLLCDRAQALGQPLTVNLPLPRGSDATLGLRGEVIRCGPSRAEGGLAHEFALAIRFDPLQPGEVTGLKAILRERLLGPAAPTVAAGEAEAPTLTGVGPPRCGNAARAGASAVRFEREVTAICGDATRSLIGRDLTPSGMRVDTSARLRDRERLRLALHGSAREEPILIEAHTERSAAEVWIRFDYVDPDSQKRLERLIASLPKLHRLDDDAPTHTAVVAGLVRRGSS